MICPFCRETEIGEDTSSDLPAQPARLGLRSMTGESVCLWTRHHHGCRFSARYAQSVAWCSRTNGMPAFAVGPPSARPRIDGNKRPPGAERGPGAGRGPHGPPPVLSYGVRHTRFRHIFLSTFWLEGSAPADRYLGYLITQRLFLRWDRSTNLWKSILEITSSRSCFDSNGSM